MDQAERYGAYNRFAWFYSKGWGDEFHAQARPVLENHIFPRVPPGAAVLDLCCGSGDLSRFLAERGYRVTGVDGSEEMLRYARRRVPCAEFILQDAREFTCSGRFACVLSTFDSLNHILALDEIERVFAHVFDCLHAGGLFAFDLNMAEAFETLWRGTFASVEDEAAAITRGTYDAQTGIGRAEVTVFRLEDGAWRRSDVCVPERCYTEAEITGALQRRGFREIEASDAWELGMRGGIALGRRWFFAVKPAAAP